MIEITAWAAGLAQKLSAKFGPRLLFVGYQGSYGRGEATPESDIDIAAVLDRVELPDLEAYRGIVTQMPSGELACGFICGLEQLKGWPAYDRLGLLLDTIPVLGDLHELVPEPRPDDVHAALHNGASMLYHAACHSFLYGDRTAALPELRKSAFFCLRMAYLLRTGEYVPSRRALTAVLPESERALLTSGDIEESYRVIIDWSGAVLARET